MEKRWMAVDLGALPGGNPLEHVGGFQGENRRKHLGIKYRVYWIMDPKIKWMS